MATFVRYPLKIILYEVIALSNIIKVYLYIISLHYVNVNRWKGKEHLGHLKLLQIAKCTKRDTLFWYIFAPKKSVPGGTSGGVPLLELLVSLLH